MEMTIRRCASGHCFGIDATLDKYNIWWAIAIADVTDGIDMAALAHPMSEVRVEARVRPSHAPRRINLRVRTQRTRDISAN